MAKKGLNASTNNSFVSQSDINIQDITVPTEIQETYH
jgi:hypothetical protein